MRNRYKLLLAVLSFAAVISLAGCQNGNREANASESVTETAVTAENTMENTVANTAENSTSAFVGASSAVNIDGYAPDDVFEEITDKPTQAAEITDAPTETNVPYISENVTEPPEEVTKQVMDYHSKGEGIVLPDDEWE